MINPFSAPDFPTMYSCIGLVQGQYFPSVNNFTQGVLVATDGSKYPAALLGKVAKWLQSSPDRCQESHFWTVWPRSLKESPGLFLTLKGIIKYTDEKRQAVVTAGVDYFSIRGVVVFQNDGRLGIRISRNHKPPAGEEKAKRWQPFVVVVDGFLPTASRGEFWELDCYRDGERLVMKDARLISDAPKANNKRKEISPTTPTERSPNSPAGEPLSENVKAPLSENVKARSTQSAQPQGNTMTTPGNLEITIKINSLPNARTVENGWQQFDLDCNGQIVSVKVKPKVWKKLLDAQANYPKWVAAIAGKMGERTENGFVLLEPNIQTFEKKPKEEKVKEPAVGAG